MISINSNKNRIASAINDQARLSQRIDRLQTDIGTGTRLRTRSDDVVGAARVAHIDRRMADMAVARANLTQLAANAAAADTAIASAGQLTQRARELLVTAANGTSSAEGRAAIAAEMRALADQMTALGTTQASNGELLFSADAALAVPIIDGVRLTAADRRDAVFGGVATAAGPQDAAAILTNAAAAVSLADPALRAAAIATAQGEVVAADNHLTLVRATHGAVARRIDDVSAMLGEETTTQRAARSAIADTDVVQAVGQLQGLQLSLQAAQNIFARVNRATLFDVLR